MKNKAFIPRSGQFKPRPQRRGQMLVLFAILTPLFFGMLGLSIDAALMYRTKAILSKTADATALRLARKFESSDVRINMALTVTQANMTGFLSSGYTQTGPTGDVGDPAGETIILTDNTDPNTFIKMVTKADPDIGIITVDITLQASHKTYFMPIFGSNLRTQIFQEFAEAQRYPSVNALVLDVSGSMNDSATASQSKAGNMVAGVKAFIAEFDENRDYMLVVTFSNRATVIWPKTPDYVDSVFGPFTGQHYFAPSKNFKSGINGDATNSISWVLDNRITIGGSTLGQDGIRLAADCVEKFIENEVDPNMLQYLQINYIFFTDGEFNTIRTYIKGTGYGRDLSNSADTGPSRLSIHNSSHIYNPLVAKNLNVTHPRTGDNLSGIFGTYSDSSKIPGINGRINGSTIGSFSNSSAMWSSGSSKFTGGNSSDFTVEPVSETAYNDQDWNYDLEGDGRLTSTITSANPKKIGTMTWTGSSSPPFGRLLFIPKNGAVVNNENGNTYTGANFQDIVYSERKRLYNAPDVTVPSQTTDDVMNPYLGDWDPSTQGTRPNSTGSMSASFINRFVASSTPSTASVTLYGLSNEHYQFWYNRAQTGNSPSHDTTAPSYIPNEWLDSFPYGREYANMLRLYSHDTYSTDLTLNTELHINKTRNPWVFVRSSSGSSIGNAGSVRLSDLYIDYYLGGGDAELTGNLSNVINGTSSGGESAFNPRVVGTGVDATLKYTNVPNVRGDGRNVAGVNPGPTMTDRLSTTTVSNRDFTLDSSSYFSSSFNEQSYLTGSSAYAWWNWKTHSWQTAFTNSGSNSAGTGSNSDMTYVSYWMSEAQCYLLRTQQKAVIYTITYGSGAASSVIWMKRYANDPRYSSTHISGQTDGVYYNVSDTTTSLSDIFKDIAAKIAVRLAK